MVSSPGCHVPPPPLVWQGRAYDSHHQRCHAATYLASLQIPYWAKSLHAATYLLNLLPTKAISAPSPHLAVFDTAPSYAHLRVFWVRLLPQPLCYCYPKARPFPVNVSSSLIPRLPCPHSSASISPQTACLPTHRLR
jgi:hypothetical protein